MYLITGASGFVGKAVIATLLAEGHVVRACTRAIPSKLASEAGLQWQAVGDINYQTNWRTALQGISTVVHCAARAHVMREDEADALAAYRGVNVDGTLRLGQQAAEAGVKRFVFLSSIKVNGETTVEGSAFTETDAPAPEDAYGQSKLEAEQALLYLAKQTSMEVVIIRPPLVYGPGVKGNFASMLQWVQRGIPLPLGAVHNQRSLVALDNLVSLLLLCADRDSSPKAANQVFLVSDGEDVSTATLLRKVALAASHPSRLVPVPVRLLWVGAALLGKQAVADRLLGNLQVDSTKACKLLGWCPPVTMDQQLATIFK